MKIKPTTVTVKTTVYIEDNETGGCFALDVSFVLNLEPSPGGWAVRTAFLPKPFQAYSMSYAVGHALQRYFDVRCVRPKDIRYNIGTLKEGENNGKDRTTTNTS